VPGGVTVAGLGGLGVVLQSFVAFSEVPVEETS
jgi:hypothetical protein